MIEFIKYASTSLLWGFLMGLFCLGLFFIIIKGWWKDARFTFKSYLTGCVLGLILVYQCILLCGAVIVINMADDSEPVLTSYVNQYSTHTEQILSKEESDKLLSDFIRSNPLVAHHIDSSKLQDCPARELPSVIISQVKSSMRWFIFRRVLWCLGFTLIAAILVIKSISRQQDGRRERNTRDRERIKRNTRTRINRYRH